MVCVLVVDDEETMRAAVRMALEQAFYTVLEASNGEAALKQIASAAVIDAVLLDVRMPGLDGIQTLERIRATHKSLPVIMVTGYGSMDAMTKAMALGANQYISKPFKNKEIFETLHNVLGKSPSPPIELQAEAIIVKEPEKPKRRWPAVLGAFVVLLGIGLTAMKLRHTVEPPAPVPAPVPTPVIVKRDFALPYSNPTGLIWQDDKLWVLDWLTQSIYVHELRGNELPIIKTYHLPSLHVTGMALAEGMLFTCDPWTKKIQKHKLDEFLTVVASFPSPGPSPSALFWDGKYLWCTDSSQGKIYQLQPAQKQILIATHKMPGERITSFYSDANYAWTLDSQARKIYQHRLDDDLSAIANYSSEEFDRGPEPLASFSWRKDELWYVRDRKPILYRRDPKSLTRNN